jgi:hypothetical protein
MEFSFNENSLHFYTGTEKNCIRELTKRKRNQGKRKSGTISQLLLVVLSLRLNSGQFFKKNKYVLLEQTGAGASISYKIGGGLCIYKHWHPHHLSPSPTVEPLTVPQFAATSNN